MEIPGTVVHVTLMVYLNAVFSLQAVLCAGPLVKALLASGAHNYVEFRALSSRCALGIVKKGRGPREPAIKPALKATQARATLWSTGRCPAGWVLVHQVLAWKCTKRVGGSTTAAISMAGKGGERWHGSQNLPSFAITSQACTQLFKLVNLSLDQSPLLHHEPFEMHRQLLIIWCTTAAGCGAGAGWRPCPRHAPTCSPPRGSRCRSGALSCASSPPRRPRCRAAARCRCHTLKTDTPDPAACGTICLVYFCHDHRSTHCRAAVRCRFCPTAQPRIAWPGAV
jgi:hypothetical protein